MEAQDNEDAEDARNTHFNMKGWAPRRTLRKRSPNVIWKWLIVIQLSNTVIQVE